MYREKITFLALSPVLLGLLVLNFFNRKPTPVASTEAPIPMCAPQSGPAYPDAKPFNPNEYLPAAVTVRKNISSFSAAEITALRAGVAAMKALPVTDKTSWQYQAAIHGTTLPAAGKPLWNTCTHSPSPDAVFFLSWHRMYLYFFERILRAKSGDPNLTLPYWDYQTSAAIPSPYRTPANATNSLYHASRAASMNGGGSLPASISTSINNALNNVNYMTFQSALEGPHGSVHGAIGGAGGDMSAVNKAALDPVFWLHHTNIDRLWEAWLRKCGGRTNPTDATWLNKTYSFIDETGATVNMTGSQVVSTASSLGYRYDFPLMLPCNFKWNRFVWREFRPFRLPDPPVLERNLLLSLANARTLDDVEKVKQFNFAFQNSEKEISDQILLEFENARITQVPEGVVEVYVNLASTQKPLPQSKNFAGVIDFFGNAKEFKALRVDITEPVKNLKIKAAELNKMKITFVVRGNTLNGKEIDVRTSFKAENLDVIVRRGTLQ